MEDKEFVSDSFDTNDAMPDVPNAKVSISMVTYMENGATETTTTMTRSHGIGSWFTFSDECHKRNFIINICVYFSFMSLGWTYGQLGTAFPDFQLILKAGVRQTSLVFTMNSIGYMTGSMVISGVIYERVDKLLLLSVVSMLMAITSVALPHCTRFWLFLAVRLVGGLSCGGLDASGNAKVASSWGTKGRQYMQALHFSYALGGIISPLITSPFLAPSIPRSTSGVYTDESGNHTTILGNYTMMGFNGTVAMDMEIYDSESNDDVIIYGETRVHYAFLITGILCFVASVLYFVLYMKGYSNTPPYTKNNGARARKEVAVNVNNKRVHMHWYHVVMFLVMLGLMLVVYGAIECKLQSFLMPFVIMQLDWSKQNGAILGSLLWALFGAGRLLGIVISRYLQPSALIVLFMSLNVLSSFGILLGGLLISDALIWLCIPLSGLMISVLFPTFLVWTGENALRISGRISAFYMCVASLGFMIDPLYIGKLMEEFTPMYFAYVQVGEAVLCLLFFLILLLGIRYLRRNSTGQHSPS